MFLSVRKQIKGNTTWKVLMSYDGQISEADEINLQWL